MYPFEDKTIGEGLRCRKCGLTFAIVFPISDELGNGGYRIRLKELIADDCKRGKHKNEYLIDDTR